MGCLGVILVLICFAVNPLFGICVALILIGVALANR